VGWVFFGFWPSQIASGVAGRTTVEISPVSTLTASSFGQKPKKNPTHITPILAPVSTPWHDDLTALHIHSA
jgi:hypothetical protein